MKQTCELKGCISNYGDLKLISVNENIGDECYNVSICRTCADALGMKKRMDLPDANIVEKKLKSKRGEKSNRKINI